MYINARIWICAGEGIAGMRRERVSGGNLNNMAANFLRS